MAWAYTDDMTVPLNLARFMLADNVQAAARLKDEAITSTLDVFGWQKGMSVLAQNLITNIDQEVLKTSSTGSVGYEWATKRTDQLRALKEEADKGTLPEPGVDIAAAISAGTVTVLNAPIW